MKIIDENTKIAFKQPTTQRKGVVLINGNYYDIYNVEYNADCYDEGKVIGNAIASQLDFDIPYMPKFDTFQYFDCILVNDNYVPIDYGNFTVFDEYDQDEFNKHITAFDNLIKFNKPFENLGGYPKTLYNELLNVCQQAGVELANLSIPNGNFIVQSNQFTDGQSLKTVLKQICAISGNYAIVKNNILHLQLKNTTNEVINKSQHEPVDWKRRSYGINQVILGDSQIEGEYVIREDAEDIALNGVHKLEILDNLFAYTQDKRSALIDNLFNQVRGFGYIPFETKGEWLSYLEIGDTINLDGVDTILLRINANSPQSLNSTMSAPAIIDSSIEYVNNTDDIDNRLKLTERSVDKQNQIITDVVSNVSEQNTKISQITQTVDEINSKISDIADITVSGESSYASVNLTGINESEPILLKVRPIGDNISYLYPRSNLYPSNTLYSTIRKIRFTNNTTNENFDYILPDDLLYYNSENYDEFNLNYESQTCSVTKKCKYNADGTVSLLSQPIVTNYPYPTIPLTEGDYTVSILTYNSGYIYVTLMAKNIYTTQFYTKVETNSIIDQTASSIDLSVNQKLSNYSTTTEMNSAITIKANEINSVVSTKVGNNEVISKINQSAEAITISANKIAISGVISAINNNTTTTINGNKITTGSIAAAQISSNAITSDKIAANAITSAKIATGAINADKIAAGAITASKVSSDIITTSNFSAQRINADNITSGTISGRTISGGSINGSAISGGSININKSGYYFNMGLSTSHPNCSGLNVGNGGININNLGFNSDGSSFTFSSRINVPVLYASTYLTTNRIEANGGVNIHSGGNDGSYANNGGIYMATGQVSGTPSHITLNAQPGYGFVYAEGNGTPRGRVAIDSSGPSSRCLKDNIKDYTNEEYSEALKLLDDIKIYNYDYKYNIHPKENQYGFIIDDLLENKLANKFLYFKDETAGVMKDGRLDYSANEKENQSNLPIIDFKRYDEETLIKYLLVVCKALQIKINKMEEKNGK